MEEQYVSDRRPGNGFVIRDQEDALYFMTQGNVTLDTAGVLDLIDVLNKWLEDDTAAGTVAPKGDGQRTARSEVPLNQGHFIGYGELMRRAEAAERNQLPPLTPEDMTGIRAYETWDEGK